MTSLASGSFDVKITPDSPGEREGRTPVGRMLIDKQYRGPLVGSGQGDMLTAGNPASGTAAYVALEHVTGTLDGKQGGFVLQHAGTMQAGAQQLTINIVPGSGTGELSGITGTCKIDIVKGDHFYEIAYSL